MQRTLAVSRDLEFIRGERDFYRLLGGGWCFFVRAGQGTKQLIK